MTSRMNGARWGASAFLALALTVSGCSSDDGGKDAAGAGATSSGSTPSTPSAEVSAAAQDAAASYLTDLRRYQREVSRAAATTATTTPKTEAAWRKVEGQFASALDAAPELEPVEGGAESNESYARMSEIDSHVQGFVAEHEWLSRWDVHEAVRVHGELYTLDSDQFSEQMRQGTAWERTMSGPGNADAKIKKALAQQVRTQLKNIGPVRQAVDHFAGDDSFTPSLRDHVLHELDITEALGERYLEYVETSPASTIERDLFRNGFAGGSDLPGMAVSNAPFNRRVAQRKLLAKMLTRLVKAAESGQGELPMAGDIYRELILREFTAPTAKNQDEARTAVDEQLYWLWHIREIEDTPDEAFDNARLTIRLQLHGPTGLVKVNVPSRFDELIAMYAAMGGIFNDPESMTVNKPWIIELLDRPYPHVLDKAVGLTREAAELMPEDGSPASRKLLAIGPRIRKALEQAADKLDSAPRFRRDFRAAISATRPDPSA